MSYIIRIFLRLLQRFKERKYEVKVVGIFLEDNPDSFVCARNPTFESSSNFWISFRIR